MDRQKIVKNKLFLVLPILFFFLVFSVGVNAQPPFESAAFTAEGIIIEFPNIELLKANQDFTFNFHTFNQSTGFPLFNDTTSCNFHLYNLQGEHLIVTPIPFDIVSNDFEITISGGNFSQGQYSFLTDCNTTVLGGAINGFFVVTPEGNTAKNFPIALVFVIIAYLLVLFSFATDNIFLGMFSGLLLGILGLLALNNGIDLIRDTGTEIFAQISMWIGFITFLFYTWKLIEDAGIDLTVK